MYQSIKSCAPRVMRGWPMLALLSTIPLSFGCANPPPLTETGSGGLPPPPRSTISLVPLKPGAMDPGPRGGLASAGGPFAGLSPGEVELFDAAIDVFKEVDSVSGTIPDIDGSGLGPTFNSDACGSCHKQPAVGGVGANPNSQQEEGVGPNPQIAVALLEGAGNTIPFFITPDGPVREARFKSDGGVHGLFTIQGRTDAPGCTMRQPDFATENANGNLVFRTVLPVFGDGLVENTPDTALEANLASTAAQRQALGIGGHFNRSGNDGSIMRFGWKAQNKSLLVFAGEAYNVEQGVSNEMFMNERSVTTGCAFNRTPEDHTNNEGLETGGPIDMVSDIVSFAFFMRLSAPPTPAAPTPLTTQGADVFNRIGCGACHSATLTTRDSIFTGMSNFSYHPLSDFALHHMGGGLADGIVQGDAGGDEFRTTPLWGLGQRFFFLHDGRSGDLGDAIEQHASPGSEANAVIANFNALGADDQNALLAYLRSL
jgi:CxxC motif-containing protein (DUF1111 family)